jgi:3-phenylpropionate/trans-cinnamate dioxygenase ferredoxin subunit
MYNWHLVENITASGMAENSMVEVTVADKQVGLLKRGEKVLAFSAKCPHASANLCEGWIDARGHIACPLHSYRFDPVNGRNTSGEGYKLKTYPVEIKEDLIYIGII